MLEALFEFEVGAGKDGVGGEVGFEVCGCFGGVGGGDGYGGGVGACHGSRFSIWLDRVVVVVVWESRI